MEKRKRKTNRTVEETTNQAIRPRINASSSSSKYRKYDQQPAPDVEQATSMLNKQVNEQGTINRCNSSMHICKTKSNIF